MTLSTTRKCPQCGNEVTPTARFCTECGSSMTPTSGGPSGPGSGSPGFGSPNRPIDSMKSGAPPLAPTIRTEPHPDATQRTIMGILIGAVVLLSIVVAVLVVTLRRVNNIAVQPCVAAPSLAPLVPAGAGEAHLPSAASISPSPTDAPITPTTPAITPAPAGEVPKPSTGTTTAATAPASASTQAPADVIAYFKFLQTIDQKRIALMSNPAAAEPAGSTTDQSGTSTGTDWQSILTEFQSHVMPDSCSTFGNEYLPFLTDCQAAAGKSVDQIAPVAAEAARLDKDLETLCGTLHMVKPFNITMPVSMAPPAATQ